MIVADNGAFTLRIGLADSDEPLCLPNQVARVRGDLKELVADECEAQGLAHHGQLEYKRPHSRGLMVDCQTEEKIWERAIGRLNVTKRENLVVTESPLVPQAIALDMDELYFERLGFSHVARMPPCSACALDYCQRNPQSNFSQATCRTVVDVGYSVTWICPILGATLIPSSARRLDIGGKLLTNLLKEEVTWRHFNLMDETHLVEKMKRDTCFM